VGAPADGGPARRAGMQVRRRVEYLLHDRSVRQRTSVFTSIASRSGTTVIASSGPDFVRFERRRFALLFVNEPLPALNYTPHRVPWYFGPTKGMLTAGYEYAEVQPWWFAQGDRARTDLETGVHSTKDTGSGVLSIWLQTWTVPSSMMC
jgi:hypothetical protein